MTDAVAAAFLEDGFANQYARHPIHIGVYKAWEKSMDFGDESYEQIAARRGASPWLEKTYRIPRYMYYEESLSNAPHVPREPTLEDCKNGVDSVLNHGLAEIRSGL